MEPAKAYNLAIETSGRAGSVSLGRGDELLATADVGKRRHAVGLMPAIDALCREHGVQPAELGEVYVSVGPGSFTGLRIGVTTAKMLSRVVGAKLVAVDTLPVVATNAPAEAHHVAVCLNAKRGQYYAGVFTRDKSGELQPVGEAGLWTIEQVLERLREASGGEPAVVIGDKLERLEAQGVSYLEGDAARAHSEVVWRLGRRQAERGDFVDALAMTPKYVRLPEAEEVWRKRTSDV